MTKNNRPSDDRGSLQAMAWRDTKGTRYLFESSRWKRLAALPHFSFRARCALVATYLCCPFGCHSEDMAVASPDGILCTAAVYSPMSRLDLLRLVALRGFSPVFRQASADKDSIGTSFLRVYIMRRREASFVNALRKSSLITTRFHIDPVHNLNSQHKYSLPKSRHSLRNESRWRWRRRRRSARRRPGRSLERLRSVDNRTSYRHPN
jgi:hypothetical protein